MSDMTNNAKIMLANPFVLANAKLTLDISPGLIIIC